MGTTTKAILIATLTAATFNTTTTRAQNLWEQSITVTSPDLGSRTGFGQSLAVSGNLLLVGSPKANGLIDNAGSAYLYDIRAGVPLMKFAASDGSIRDLFGNSVATNGTLAVIGAPTDARRDIPGSIYTYDLNTGEQLAKITAPDGTPNNQFGWSVAINGNLVLIGATADDEAGEDAGAAYLYDLNTGEQLFKFTAADEKAFDEFGFAVALDNQFAFVTALSAAGAFNEDGAVYVFDLTTGEQVNKINATNDDRPIGFGKSIAISESRIAIGTSGENQGDGAVYVYDRPDMNRLFKWTEGEQTVDGQFGSSVALSGNTALVGARHEIRSEDQGKAYLYDLTTGERTAEISPTGIHITDLYGAAVAINGNRAVVGSPESSELGLDTPAVYIWQDRTENILSISPDPLRSEQPATFTLINALPNEPTWLLYSVDGLQPTFLENLNVIVDIKNPHKVTTARMTDANGNFDWHLTMPRVTQPINLWLQSVQHARTSNVIPTQLTP